MSSMDVKREIDKMNTVKVIPMLDGFNGCTIRMAADYFEVPYQNVYQRIANNKEEFTRLGMAAINVYDVLANGYRCAGGSTYERHGKQIKFQTPFSKVYLLTKECMLALSKHMSRNALSRKITEAISSKEQIKPSNALVPMEYYKDFECFSNAKFGELRVIMRDGEPWFVAADVCRALEIVQNRNAVARLDDDEKDVCLTDTLGGKQNVAIINEPGLYTLVLGSRKPEAKAFKRWITHEVIPTIRKNGMYIRKGTSMEGNNIEALLKKLGHMEDLINDVLAQNKLANDRIALLEHKNELTVSDANKLLFSIDCKGIRKAISRMMCFYAGKKCYGRFGYAWAELYRQINDRYGIDVYQRKQDSDEKKCLYIDLLTDSEIMDAYKVCDTMCRNLGATIESFFGAGSLKMIDQDKEGAA